MTLVHGVLMCRLLLGSVELVDTDTFALHDVRDGHTLRLIKAKAS